MFNNLDMMFLATEFQSLKNSMGASYNQYVIMKSIK